jgi:outer membrane protein assembly factor BamB
VLAACSRDPTPARVAPPTTPLASAAAAPAASPGPVLDPLPAPADREIAHGVVVDLRARKEARTLLTDDDVWNGVDDGTRAYVHLRADYLHRFKEEVRAYDLATGRVVWARQVGRCYLMTAASAGVFCDSDQAGEITLFDRETGSARSLPVAIAPNISSIERVGTKIVVLSWSSTQAVFFDATTAAPAGTLTLPLGFTVARVLSDVVCGASFDQTAASVACFDATPRVSWSTRIAIADGEVRMADDHDLLITTRMWGSRAPPESVVVALDGGKEIARASTFASCLVRGPNGRLEGLFRATKPVALLDLNGHERWTTTALAGEGSASTVLTDDALFVASYDHITTGAELVALDRATGATRWRGSIELLPISHSHYSNEVSLRLFSGAIVMRGLEEMQDYLELFDPGDGTRLYSTVRRR